MKTLTPMRSSRKRGVILIVFALGTFVLCGFAGLALDVSYLQMWQRKAQTAADAAAISAALDLKRNRNSQSALSAAFVDAAANGFTHNVDSTVVVENPPQAGPNQGNSKYVRVTVQRPAPTYFMRVFGRDSVTVGANASSGLADMGLCVFVLNPTTNAALHVSGTPDVNVSCAVQVNSTSANALHVTGAAEINTTGFNVVGGALLAPNATITPVPATGMSAEDDPLAWRSNPPAGASCDHVNFKVNGGRGNNTLDIEPGVYCGGIDLNTQRPVHFEAGLYVLMGGGLKINSQSQVSGTNVTFFNTGSANYGKGNISITGQATINLRAPRSGPYEAMLIWEDRNLPGQSPNHVEGGSDSDIEGIIYMPKSDLSYAGGSGTNAAYTAVVADTLKFTGHSRFTANYTVLASGSPMVRSVLLQ